MLVVVYERGLHLSHILLFFFFVACWLRLPRSGVWFSCDCFFQSATSFFFLRVGTLHTVLLWSHFGSADGLTAVQPPDVLVDTAGTGGPDFFQAACGGPSELSPFALGFMQSSVTCLHGRAILASDAT